MTKRLLFYPLATLVVGAALLFAALFSANIHAQVYDFDSANVESLSEINPMLSAGAVLAPGLLVGHSDGLGSWTPIAPVGVSPQALYILDAATITIGDMDIEFLADGTLKFDDSRAEEFTTGLAAAVATNDNTGSFDLNDIVFVGVRDTGNGEAYGFAYVAAAPFTGGVIEGKTITVIGMNNATLGTTQVRGVSFDDGAAGKQHLVGTDITFGNITVASEGAQAWGFYVYGDVDTDSKVNLGDIFAQGAANARGIYVDKLEGETTVGKITAISSNNFARGVQASGIENLTVNGDIIAIGDSAHGILTDKWGTSSDTLPTTGNGNVADLFVAGTITAKATGSGGARGIQVGGDVTGNIDVVGGIQATSTTGSAVGIQVNGAITNANIDAKGNLSVGGVNGHSIVATATSGSAYGIYGGGPVTGSTIDIGNISATSTTGAAYGVAFGDEIGAGSNLEFGKIAATVSGTTSEGAIGFVSGAVTEDATITFKGDVDAIATDGEYAVGVQFGDVVGGLETVAGTVEIGNITAKSDGVAQGLLFGGTTGIGSVKVGKITVVSTGTGPLHGAFGIQAEDYANLILNGDINVTGARTDDFAAGVRLDNGGTLTLAKSVKINAALGVAEGYGIWSQGNLNINLAGFDLSSNSTQALSNVTLESYDEGEVLEGATANLGKVNIAGSLDVYDGIVATIGGGSVGAVGIYGTLVVADNTTIVDGGDIDILGGTGNITAGGSLWINDTVEDGFEGDITVNNAGLYVQKGQFNNLTATGGSGSVTATVAEGDQLSVAGAISGRNVSIENDGVFDAESVSGRNVSIQNDGIMGIDSLSGRTVNVTNGSQFTANSVSGYNVAFAGNGRAVLDTVSVSGDFNIGSNNTDTTTVVVDGVEIFKTGGWLGNVKLGDASKLEIFGDTADRFEIGQLDDPLQAGRIASMSTFTKWGYDPGTGYIMSLGMRDRVYANDNYLVATQMHHKYTGLYAVRDHVISGATMAWQGAGYYGQAPCDCSFGCEQDTSCKKAKTRGAWANYIGRDSRYQSSFNGNDWKITNHGVQVGTDFFRTQKHQFGAFFGYEDSTASNIGDRVKGKDYYVGAYGVHVFNGGADVRTIFTYGWQDFKSLRNGQRGVYRTAFDGNTVELNVELGKRHYFGGHNGIWSTRPSVALDWYLSRLGGGWETGGYSSYGAMRYGSKDFSQLFFRFGTDLRYERGPWALEGGVYYSYDMLGADLRSSVSDVQTGSLVSTLGGSKLGRSVLSYNLGSSWLVCRNFTVFGGYRGEVAPEQAGRGYAHTGYVGGAWRW